MGCPSLVISSVVASEPGHPHFGWRPTNPQSGHSTSGQTRNPVMLAGFHGNNEVMFRHGIDLLGAEAPTRIKCTSAKERSSILTMLKARGIHKLGSKPIQEVVQ